MITIFWSDLASSYYATDVVTWLTSESIGLVKRKNNLANGPQLRPLEHFWSILNYLVYENGFQATSRDDLVQGIKQDRRCWGHQKDDEQSTLKDTRKKITALQFFHEPVLRFLS